MYKQHAGRREIADYKKCSNQSMDYLSTNYFETVYLPNFCQNLQHETMQYRCLNMSQHLQTYISCIHYTHVYTCRQDCGLDNILTFSLETTKTTIKKTTAEKSQTSCLGKKTAKQKSRISFSYCLLNPSHASKQLKESR